MHPGLGAPTFRRHANGVGGGQEKLHFIRREHAFLGGKNGQHAKRQTARGNGRSDAGDHAVRRQNGRQFELGLDGNVIHHRDFAREGAESQLRVVFVELIGLADGVGFPAGSGEHQQASVRHAFKHGGVFNGQHLPRHERALGVEGVEIVDDQRALAQRGHNGLLVRMIPEFPFGGVALRGTLLQGSGHFT